METVDWTGVRERVHALRAAPWAAEVHGAFFQGRFGHRFQLWDPLSPEELAEAERQWRLVFPEDYRGFLVTVGAGGAGPGYGVYPLRHSADAGWEWHPSVSDRPVPERITQPFGGEDGVRLAIAALAAHATAEPKRQDYSDPETFEAARRAWHIRDDEIYDDVQPRGALAICHHGCATYSWLAVTGDEAGTMWSDPGDGYNLRAWADPPKSRITFGRWYLRWLDAAERTAGVTS